MFPFKKETFYIYFLLKRKLYKVVCFTYFMKNVLKTIIKDFQERKLDEFILRNIEVPLDSKKIITLIGPRRSGKTFLLYQLISKLNTSFDNILYINFEDERLNFETENLDEIIQAYLELYPGKNLKEVHFFFDEIQNVDGWEKFVRRLYDSISTNIYITGSSAKMLSKEIATSLRGRTLSYEVYPLSFKEFLLFKGVRNFDSNSTKSKAKIISEFQNYSKVGGFPEVVNFDENTRIKTLQNYSDVMLYRDVVERYNISSSVKLKYFLKKAVSNISKEFSINKVYLDFKSQNIEISKDSLYEYPNFFEDAYYIFFVQKYNKSVSKQEFGLRKIYSVDVGLSNSISFKFSDDLGRVFENLVFLELKRRGAKIYYHKEKQECDFLIVERLEVVRAVQVTVSLMDDNTKKREVNGLIDALNSHNLSEGLILTENEEDEFSVGDKKIIIKPIWKWLLEIF